MFKRCLLNIAVHNIIASYYHFSFTAQKIQTEKRLTKIQTKRVLQTRSRLLSFNKNVSVYTDNGSKKVKMMTMRKILGVRFKIFCLTIALIMQIK